MLPLSAAVRTVSRSRRPGDSGGRAYALARQSRRVGGGFPPESPGHPWGVRPFSRGSGRVGGNPCCNPSPEGADVSSSSRTRQVVRAVADGTGLTEEEVWIRAGVTVVVVTVLGVLHTVELMLDLVADISDLARE